MDNIVVLDLPFYLKEKIKKLYLVRLVRLTIINIGCVQQTK